MKKPSTVSSASDQLFRLREQVKAYLQEPCVTENDVNPLAYWALKKTVWSELSQLACSYLHVPASSAGVERVFSVAGKVFRSDRCNLSDQKFSELVFIACNAKNVN